MAQWAHQYSGLSHYSKVRDREQILRHAVEVYRTKENADERHGQARNIQRLAHRLLIARVRAMKAACRKPAKVEEVRKGGIKAILVEFDAADISE